ncbi:MAG: family 78 glycoside hydrolase catalytic domain [Candidatus Hermodarchaeota archaeon]
MKLRCEYLENPLGIDEKHPRLSWKLKADHRGAKQTAYQIQCASTPNFDLSSSLIWDTGKITSDQSTHVEYKGRELKSRERIYWRVKVWNELNEASEWSEVAWWEMGLLDIKEWKAKWIDPEEDINPKEFQPAPYLRKEFQITGLIDSARLYITAHGVYEVWINGKRVGNQYFTPGRTCYDKRLQYQVYDVSSMIQEGKNTLGVILGDGWWRGSLGAGSRRNVNGERLALLAQLYLNKNDQTEQLVITDESWKCTSDGPIIQSDVKEGEVYDARKEIKDWNKSNFDDSHWNNVKIVDYPYNVLIASMGLPIREKEQFKPIKIINTPVGETVLDFGQNIAGYVEMRLDETIPSGTNITLIHGETLDEHGNFTQKNIMFLGGKEYQKDIFIHNGVLTAYKPHFSVKGFRYVKIEGYPKEIDPQKFTAIAIYSDMEQTGDFQCSNNFINQLVKNIRWSQKGNFLDIPTDCPTRERSGWTGDAQIFTFAGSLLMNIAPFLSKWMKDVAASQKPNGMILNIVPPEAMLRMLEGSAGWIDANIIIPWTIWKIFADSKILSVQYDSMKALVEYQRHRAQKIHRIRKYNPLNWSKRKREKLRNMWDTNYHWGEWSEASVTSHVRLQLGVIKRLIVSEPEVATAYYAYSTRLFSEIASHLGKEDDAQLYRTLSEKATQAYQQTYLKKGRIKSKRQARFVRPLALGLVPKEYEQTIADQLAELVKHQGYCVGTGFLSTPFLCEVLDQYGHLDTAYRLINQTSQPSWLYAVNKGATTIWESWHGMNEDGKPFESLNHYSYGAILGWLFKTVVGIKPDLTMPGFKHFYLDPQPGGGLTQAEGTFDSMYGIIKSSWEIDPDDPSKIHYQFIIPPNTSATVKMRNTKVRDINTDGKELTALKEITELQEHEDSVEFMLRSGEYSFEVKNS